MCSTMRGGEVGELIGSGRDADVYALDDSWVLRRNRDGRSQRREAAVMAHLYAHGYPVPRIHPARDDRADLIMQRVDGPTLLDTALAGEIEVAEVGAVLADLLNRLHAVPPREAGDAGTVILHLDLHPLNVIRAPDGPVVIDWSNTREGAPAQDWAMSALILAQAALDGSDLSHPADAVLSALLSHRPATVVFDDATLARVHADRAADPHLHPGDLDAALALVIARAG
jgi:aminoglycoside phosphotransferase (APT) family kinase protein